MNTIISHLSLNPRRFSVLTFSFVIDRARLFIRHGLHLIGSLVDDFLNLSPVGAHEEDSYYSDPYQPARSSPNNRLSTLTLKTAGLATIAQIAINMLNRLPLAGLLLMAGGVVAGLVLVALDPDTLQNLRDKLSP